MVKKSLKQTIDRFPSSPGVYLMKDRRGNILYVGKAKDLRTRVRAYSATSSHHSPKTEIMLTRVQQIDFIVTDSEVEAYILESNLIKKNRPRYNILLRDDKHYPYLRLSVQEDFPRLDVVRKIKKDGARYFGPFVPGSGLRPTLDLIEKTFPLRRCKNKAGWKTGRPCLNAQIGRCLCPCTGAVSKAEYGRIVRQVILFLKGKNKELIQELTKKMAQASKALEFEKAATIRDQIHRIEKVTAQQKIISPSMEDKDIFGVKKKGEAACVEILFVRSGKLLGKKDFFIDPLGEETEEELLTTTLMQYYGPDRLVPSRIFIPCPVPEKEMVEEVLSSMQGGRVRMHTPQRGINHKLIRMANENASLSLDAYLQRKHRDLELLKDLQETAQLKRLPMRIEAFDISNIQGEFPVASMVVFDAGKSMKSHYRHYRIQSVEGANDYAMMEEVLMRRYRSREDSSLPLPDLVLMDGGKGQLSVLLQVVQEKGFLMDRDCMALAKARSNHHENHTVDRIFMPGQKDPIVLKPEDPVIHLLQRIRDESHRFAVHYYRKLYTRETLSSRLLAVRGVGKKRTLSLLRHFGSLENVRQASLEELVQVPTMNQEVASLLFHTLHSEERQVT